MSYLTTTRTANDLLLYVKRQFGDESGVQITDADILRWANAGQIEIFRRNKPIKATSTADLTKGITAYTFPNNVMMVQSIVVGGLPIPQRSFEEAQAYGFSVDPLKTNTGDPQFWWEFGGTFSFYPVPDKTVVAGIILYYLKGPTDLIATTDLLSVPDMYYNRLVEYVMSQAYELDENLEASQLKNGQFEGNLLSQVEDDSTIENFYPRITVLAEDM